MRQIYHSQVTTEALGSLFSPAALEQVISANLGQDHWLTGQIGHPEYHFDANAFAKGQAFIERNRASICPALEAGDILAARRAFGRLTHAAQDFYAHSNYIQLWLGRFSPGSTPPPQAVIPLDKNVLADPSLHSGKLFLPLDALLAIKSLKPVLLRLMPKNSHARMNLDSPERGPLFEYAFSAALKRTRIEFDYAAAALSEAQLLAFCGKETPSREV